MFAQNVRRPLNDRIYFWIKFYCWFKVQTAGIIKCISIDSIETTKVPRWLTSTKRLIIQ